MNTKGSYKKVGLNCKNHTEVFINKFKTIVVDVNVEDAVVEEKKLKVNTKGSYKKKRKISSEIFTENIKNLVEDLNSEDFIFEDVVVEEKIPLETYSSRRTSRRKYYNYSDMPSQTQYEKAGVEVRSSLSSLEVKYILYPYKKWRDSKLIEGRHYYTSLRELYREYPYISYLKISKETHYSVEEPSDDEIDPSLTFLYSSKGSIN